MGQVGMGAQLLEQVLKTTAPTHGRVMEFELYYHLTCAYRRMGRIQLANDSVEKLLGLATALMDCTLLNRACVTASLHFAESRGIMQLNEQPFRPFLALLATARQIGDPVGEARSLYHLAVMKLYRGDRPQGVQLLQDALVCLLPPSNRPTHPMDETPAKKALFLQVYGTLGELPVGTVDGALEQQLHRLDISAFLGAMYDLCRACYCLARLFRTKGDPETSRLYATRQLNIALDGGYVAEVIAAYQILGKLDLSEGAYPDALVNHRLQLERLLEVGGALTQNQEVPYFHNRFELPEPELEDLLAKAYADIVKVYLQANRFEAAWGVIQQEMESAGSASTPDWVVQTHGHEGKYHQTKGDLGSAQQSYQRQLDQAVQHGFRRDQGRASRGLAEVCHQQGDFETALAHCERDLLIRRELGDHRSTVKALSKMAEIYDQGLHQKPEAIEQLRAARDLALQTGDHRLECRVCTELGSIYVEVGQFALARQNFTELYWLAKGVKDRTRVNQARAGLRAVQEKVH
jgi:tetratricopeptide (TPR) repeat protein